MPARSGAFHVATTKRVYKGKTYVTHLLRRSIRNGKTVTHETLGNLSHLPENLPRGRLLLHDEPTFVYHIRVTQVVGNTQDRNGGAVSWMIFLASAASIPTAPSMASGGPVI